jgi:hypothetical protein
MGKVEEKRRRNFLFLNLGANGAGGSVWWAGEGRRDSKRWSMMGMADGSIIHERRRKEDSQSQSVVGYQSVDDPVSARR